MSKTATSPLRAIRAKCLNCSGDMANEVRECIMRDCSLWPFRMGHNPNRAGLGPKVPPFQKRRSVGENGARIEILP